MRFRLFTAILLLVALPTVASALWTQKKVVFHTKTAGNVVFDHDVHFDALGKHCNLCHNKLFNMVPSKNPTFTMADMDKGKACGACHNGKTAFSVKTDCASCHPNHAVTFKGPSFGKVVFSHKKHTAMFSCTACHPKRFIPGPGNKTFTMAEMDKGEACGACHNGNMAFSVKTDCASCHPTHDITFKKPSFGKVVFSHKNHTAMFGCKQCHPKRFTPGPGNKTFTMAEMDKGEACGGCHNGNLAFSVKKDCESCHNNHAITFKGPSMGTVVFSHKNHTAMFGCKQCHPKIFTPGPGNKKFTMAEMDKGEACGACHNGNMAFSVKKDCTSCHQTRDITFKGSSFGKVTFSHKKHTAMFGCKECHPKRFIAGPGNKTFTMAEMDKGEACGGCHNGSMAFSVKKDCESCHNNHAVTFKAPSMGTVTFSHKKHTAMFGCKQCHSKIFIPGPGNKTFTMAEMDKGEACGACHNGKTAFTVKANCATCHPVHTITFKQPSFGKVVFSHKVHIRKYGCKECHPKRFTPGPGNKNFTMAEMYKGKACGGCHNGKISFNVKTSCVVCHKNHDIFFKGPSFGVVVFSHKKHTAMFGCKECHPKRFIPGPGNKKLTMAEMDKGKACGSCHNGDMAFSVKNDCKNCHLDHDVVFKARKMGNVTFSHEIHTAKFNCTQCHPKLFHPGPGKVKFTMAEMYKGAACGACHDGKTAFTLKEHCARCHKK
ncbi:MAG TPA: cytochrome c3 family protein [Desulfuromonadales bacterium]|nr:cytochrome c3 family protein [Desulfuromonadales bacterium]